MSSKWLRPAVLAAVAACSLASAQQFGRPALLKGVGMDQKLNAPVPLNLPFKNESGRPVTLQEYFHGKPVVLALVYYACPMLCNMELNGLLHSLKGISLNPGDDFEVVTVSFDPRETPQLAAAKKQKYAAEYGRPAAARGWHFLTGPETSSRALADAVGFHYAYDKAQDQYAHASGIIVLTPEARVSRYFFGITYPSRDLRLGLVEASNNQIGTPADQILLFCFHYDPTKGKYGFVIINVLRAFALLTLAALGALIFFLTRRSRPAAAPGAGPQVRHA